MTQLLRDVMAGLSSLRDVTLGRLDEWQPISGGSPKLLLDGTQSEWGERLMRRRVKGVWHYRRQTKAEQKAMALDEAW